MNTLSTTARLCGTSPWCAGQCVATLCAPCGRRALRWDGAAARAPLAGCRWVNERQRAMCWCGLVRFMDERNDTSLRDLPEPAHRH
ncbi:hypothetical protein GGX14DRAFT_568213 [Mycena pura]|uniref:Uncharacterized protein n=1 Tax=Mycena pura TaxID=153505 RepID=A0AAD6Y9B7_9AGAR|nr:hypothetical protein GGX14DRAFT_568213 [Mycena pura]